MSIYTLTILIASWMYISTCYKIKPLFAHGIEEWRKVGQNVKDVFFICSARDLYGIVESPWEPCLTMSCRDRLTAVEINVGYKQGMYVY